MQLHNKEMSQFNQVVALYTWTICIIHWNAPRVFANPTTGHFQPSVHQSEMSDILNFRPISEYENMSTQLFAREHMSQLNRHHLYGEASISSPVRLLQANTENGYRFSRDSASDRQKISGIPQQLWRLYNYRPEKWHQLQMDNCYENPPWGTLTPEQVSTYEKNSKLKFFAHFPSHGSSIRNHARTKRHPGLQQKQRQRRVKSRKVKVATLRPAPMRRKTRRTVGLDADYWQNDDWRETSSVEISVHRLFIRPSILRLVNGNLDARLRYVIQLHQTLTGYYRMTVEARMNPDFPPIYVGKIHNVCAHWSSNTPQSKCSTQSALLYQKGNVCFCHMPPGIYHQRVPIKLRGLFDGLDLPSYLLSFLFQGEKIHVHLTIKVENAKGETVGCLSVKLPILLEST